MKKLPNPKMKSRYIAAALKQQIRNLASGSPLPSARDLALKYNVCMMTANRALDILEKESLIFRRKGSGNFVQKNIIRGRRFFFGIADMLERSENSARKILLDVFPETAISCFQEENCDYCMISYSDFRNHNLKAFEECDGLLISTTYIDDITEDFIRSLKIPIVLYRSEYELDLPFQQVIPNHAVVMDKLFTFAEQDKIPGIMIFCYNYPNNLARGRAFEFYAKKNHFTDDEIQFVEFPPLELRSYLVPLIREIPGKLIITCSSFMTCELIQFCNENGYRCGVDYQLICYDNLSKNMEIPPGIPEITSIDYSRTSAARTAAKLLIHAVRNPRALGCQIIKFPTQLRIRESAFKNRKESALSW